MKSKPTKRKERKKREVIPPDMALILDVYETVVAKAVAAIYHGKLKLENELRRKYGLPALPKLTPSK